jgi:hypothetical protein
VAWLFSAVLEAEFSGEDKEGDGHVGRAILLPHEWTLFEEV